MREEAKAVWAPVCPDLAVGGEHGGEFQGRSGNHAGRERQEVKPAEFLNNSLFKLDLEGSAVSGKLGLGQRVMLCGCHY